MKQLDQQKIILLLKDRIEQLQKRMEILKPLLPQDSRLRDIYQMAHTYSCNIARLADIVKRADSMSAQLIDVVEEEIADVDKVLAMLNQVIEPCQDES